MGLSEICIRRPVFATVLSLLLLLVGFVSYQRLTVREYPNIDEPVVSVVTQYPGASASIMESQVTQVLEGSIAGIEGIDVLESTSRAESSRITVRFRLEVDPNVAASDVRDRVSRVRQRLPDEITEPVISKVEADAQPVVFVVFRSDNVSALALTDYIDRNVIDRFKNVTGVADVQILGERRYAMRIWIDRERLASLGLSVQDIEDTLAKQNVEIPAGRIESGDREFTILSKTSIASVEAFENLIVKRASGALVRLGEVARVELGAADERRASRFNGESAVVIGIIKQAVANPLDVSQGVRALLPGINADLPNGITAAVGNDNSVFIEQAIGAVYMTIVEAIVLVLFVIVIFLRSARASIIPIVTIPVSLVTTCAIMYLLGFSMNTLTLLALVLAIGLVVDDAIVVLENIFRHIENGMKPFEAAIKGTREIGFAVIAMTVTLAAVYAPVAFAAGRTGKLFLEFALTLAGAVVISGFVALTLTPMMCSRLLRHQEKPGRISAFIERQLTGLESGYRRLLTASLRIRPVIAIIAVIVAAGSVFFYVQLPQELAPVEDRGVIRVLGTAPEGSTLAYTERYSRQVEDILRPYSEIGSIQAINGMPEVNRFLILGRLKAWDERGRSQQEIVAELLPKLRAVAGVNAFANNPPSLGTSNNARPIEFVLQSSASYAELDELTKRYLERLSDYPAVTNVDTDLKLNKPEMTVEIDRQKAADLGIDIAVIGRTLETLLGSRQVTRFEMNGEQYDVYVQLAAEDRQSPSALQSIFLRTINGEMVELSNLVKVTETVAPQELKRFNQMRSVTISANLAPGYSTGDVLAYMETLKREVLPENVLTDASGPSREFLASGQSLAVVFVLALGFIYLVLAAQFESFRDPLIIMISVPLSMTGALAALYLSGGSLNVYSQIGLVTLVGLITKHGILIVEFANQQREEGRDVLTAVIDAASQRLRPILMTTGAMVLGAMPLAFATGAGAESRQQIGWVIVGGMSVGTLLTLFVVPMVYTAISRQGRTNAGALPQPTNHLRAAE
ncbi:efflux RND transporter permease subunit [Agrobacterium arsenijevicii]|uniref:Multidrug transporter AcrB n=1 Tax=Agrobacterium arsenijevicii TaxID=1585697 RepID=A0ABR5D1A3_9HYPH|nr:multidrug transporter AcrB [Agrobacterium arsenijevicii]